MAKHVLKSAAVKVNSVDLSDHVRAVTIARTFDEVDVTAMGDTAKQTALGLSDDSFEVDFLQDYDTGKVDATLWPLLGGSTFLVEVWPSGTTTAATNPKFSATCVMVNYNPIAGAQGAANETTVTFKANGVAIARATA